MENSTIIILFFIIYIIIIGIIIYFFILKNKIKYIIDMKENNDILCEIPKEYTKDELRDFYEFTDDDLILF